MIDLKSDYLSVIQDILSKRLQGERIYVFGSRVNGTAKPHSDIDLMIESTEPLDENLILTLKNDFEDSDLPIRVDILDGSQLSASFRAIVDAKKVELLLH